MPFPNNYIRSTTGVIPYLSKKSFLLFSSFHENIRRPKLPRDDIESSIPQTMQLFNRMNKKTPSNVNPSSGGRGPGNRYIMQQQNQGGNESSFQSKKVK